MQMNFLLFTQQNSGPSPPLLKKSLCSLRSAWWLAPAHFPQGLIVVIIHLYDSIVQIRMFTISHNNLTVTLSHHILCRIMAQLLHQASKENNGHQYFPGGPVLLNTSVTVSERGWGLNVNILVSASTTTVQCHICTPSKRNSLALLFNRILLSRHQICFWYIIPRQRGHIWP